MINLRAYSLRQDTVKRISIVKEMPENFDAGIYRKNYADLDRMPVDQLRDHYEKCGKSEGRVASRVSDRASFLQNIPKDCPVLEIGPFLQPCLRRPAHQVAYFDVLNTQELYARGRRHIDDGDFPRDMFEPLLADIPEIDYVHPEGDLSVIDRTFDYVVSSHSIEHQVDVIKHLNDVYDLLNPGGYYMIVVPDKRYCFDHYIPTTRVVDVLGPHFEKRKFHAPGIVLEHRLETTHNDPVRHWNGDHGERRLDQWLRDRPDIFPSLWEESEYAMTHYVDVHHWKFTPDVLTEIFSQLKEWKHIKLTLVRTYPTLRNSIEFYAVLQKI